MKGEGLLIPLGVKFSEGRGVLLSLEIKFSEGRGCYYPLWKYGGTLVVAKFVITCM